MKDQEPIDPLHLRATAGRFATGITVVAAKDEDGAVHGMTANSFLCVSLEPALVLFSVQLDATFNKVLQVDTTVGISILGSEQENLSRHFAGQEVAPHEPEFIEHREAPVLHQNLAWFATQIESLIPAGDHVLVICRVLACDRQDGDPLLFFSGYRELRTLE